MSKNPRPWPVLIISSGGVVHISRANSDTIGKLHTECGRCMNHRGHLGVSPREIMDTDGKTIIAHKAFTYKFCRGCGDKQAFADAKEEFDQATAERIRNDDERREAQKDMLQRMQAAIRSTLIATALPEGSEDVEKDGWGINFTLNGSRLRLSPVDEECQRLHEISQEEGKRQWQEHSTS